MTELAVIHDKFHILLQTLFENSFFTVSQLQITQGCRDKNA